MTHPLTNEKAINLFPWEQLIDTSNSFATQDAMRTAADWQLEQVMTWLEENLSNYADDGYFAPFWELKPDLEEAMRPQEEES